MKKIVFTLLTLIILQGCAQKVSVSSCPPFPDPTDKAVDSIQGLHNTEVDDWMIRLFKLKQQLSLCNSK